MTMQKDNILKKLSRKLNYKFNDDSLLKSALTHRSYSGENNERLEFLGDAILNFMIAEALYLKFPHAKEGELSRLRSSLVKGETLAKIARDLNLGEYIRLGSGELKSGGFRRDSILSDAVEAIIAAIYLDSDMATAKTFILELFQTRLAATNLETETKDAKTQLQEILQSSKRSLPHYKLIQIEGESHSQMFSIKCTVHGIDFEATGQGSSRRRAEQNAAMDFLRYIEENVRLKK